MCRHINNLKKASEDFYSSLGEENVAATALCGRCPTTIPSQRIHLKLSNAALQRRAHATPLIINAQARPLQALVRR